MQQRLSISDLWNVLQRDPFYRDRGSIQEFVKNIIAETLKPPLRFDLNPQLKGMGCATDPIFMLIFVLCGLCRLNTYEPGKDKPTRWFGQEFADQCSYKLDLEIDRDEFKRLLRKRGFPLPTAWFLDVAPSLPAKKRRRRYHKQLQEAREIAQEAWKENHDFSAAWIIKNRLKKKVFKPNGKPFDDDTYREWIQGLRPGYRGKKTTRYS